MNHCTNNRSKILSSFFEAPSIISALTAQSNSLTQLTGESCLVAQKLERVLLVSDSELLTNAFSLIAKGINQSVSVSVLDVSSFEEYQDNIQKYDVIIPIAHDADTLKKIIQQCNTINTKIFLIAPSSLHLPPLPEIGVDIAIALESSATDLRNAFLRGIEGERVRLGFSCEVEEKYSHLTPRQRDVLKLICNGKSNKEIARELNIALSTIKVHCAAIFKELGVANRTQAALILGN